MQFLFPTFHIGNRNWQIHADRYWKFKDCDFVHSYLYISWLPNGGYSVEHKQDSNLTFHIANENEEFDNYTTIF